MNCSKLASLCIVILCMTHTTKCVDYCAVERAKCAGLTHPLCQRMNQTNSNPHFGQLLVLTNFDGDAITFKINHFRNNVALGNVTNQRPGANLKVVHWDKDLIKLVEAQLRYKNVCNRISLNDSDFVVLSTFRTEYHSNYNFKELKEVINSSYVHIRWDPLIRAEFNKIGCVITYDKDNTEYILHCLTNQKDADNMDFNPKSAYEYGKHCVMCKCSKVWSGLCDELAKETDENDAGSLNNNIPYINIEQQEDTEDEYLDFPSDNEDPSTVNPFTFVICGAIIVICIALVVIARAECTI